MKAKQMRKKLKLQKNIIIVTVSSCIAMAIAIIVLMNSAINMNNKYEKLSSDYNNLKQSTNSEIFQKDIDIQVLRSTINELNKELESVSKTNKSYVDELNELRSRKELYDKYEYAVLDEEGKRTDLKYEEIKLGEELMLEKGFNPHLMFGTIMVESNGNPLDVNKSSGATGYGQFLDETARFVWTKLMNNNNYSPEIRKHGESNIKMMAEYYDYLYSTKGNTFDVVKQYSGNSTDAGAQRYLNRINNYTRKVGVVID